jgi:hypothetical protein
MVVTMTPWVSTKQLKSDALLAAFSSLPLDLDDEAIFVFEILLTVK